MEPAVLQNAVSLSNEERGERSYDETKLVKRSPMRRSQNWDQSPCKNEIVLKYPIATFTFADRLV